MPRVTEMQDALDALRRSNQTLEAVIRASPLAIITLDEEANVTSWNAAAERIFGWTESEVLGRPLPTVPAEQREEVWRNHREAVGGRVFSNLEARRRRKDGTLIDVRISTASLAAEGDGGGERGVVALVEDITERKRAEEQLRRRERELTDFMENATVGLHWVGPDGTILWANQAELELLGYARDEYVGRNITEFHADRKAINDILARLTRGEKLHNYEARLRCKDGTIRHVLINSNVYREDDRFVHTRCFTRDITERKRAEDAIRFQAHLLDTVNQAVIATDLAGRITYWNRFAEEQYGWAAAEVLGRDIVEVTPSSSSHEQAAEIMSSLADGQSWTGEFSVRRRDGNSFPAMVTDTPVYDDAGRMIGVVGVSVDITGRKRDEDERARLAAQVEGERRRLKELVANVPGVVWEAWGEPDKASQRINFVSDYVEEMLGYTVEEWTGTPNFWLSIVHPEDRERAAREARQFFEGDERRSARQFRWLARDGRVVEVESQAVVIRDEAGRPVGMSGVTMDITERKRAEAAVRESEERFRTLADSVPVLIWVNSLAGCEFANRQYTDFLGRTLREVLEMDWTTALHPEDADAYVSAYLAAVEARAPFSAQFRFRRADGEYRWLKSDGLPRFTPDGTLIGYVGCSFDVTDMKTAEESVRASESRFRALVEQSPFSTQIFTPDGQTVQVNPAWERLWGVTLSDLAALDYNVLADEQLAELGIADYIQRGFVGEATPIPPIPYSPPAGRFEHEPRWVRAYIYPVKDDAGRVREVVLIHEDISDQRRAEEALNENRRLLQVVTDSAPVYIAYCDTEARFQFVNRNYADRFEVERESVIGKTIAEVLGAEAYEKLGEYVDAALAGRRVEFEMEIPYESLGPRIMHVDYIPHRGDAGEVQGFVAVIADVSERKRDEEEQKFLGDATTLLASSLDFETTLDAVARLSAPYLADYCLIDLLEDDGHIRRLVAAHRDPAREAAWREMQRRYPVAPDSDHTVVRVLRTGRAELFEEMDEDVLDGMIPDAAQRAELRGFGVASAMTVPLVARGRIVGAVTFIAAESGRRYTERELRLAEELARRAGLAVDNARLFRRAQEANRAKDEFLATLSHELRTPLTPVIGWVHLMRGGQIVPEDMERGLAVIDKNSQSLSRLINDLLDMSAILNSKMRLDYDPVVLDSVLRQAADTVRPQAEERGVEIELVAARDGGDGEPLAVAGDHTRLAQVFWNLLTNAIKFSREGGRVRVRVERDGEWARVHVEDEGVGIAPEFLPRVFDRFQQADMSTTKHYGGLGIGLALVRSFVEAHGGAVSAASAGVGRGSRFTVSLPLYGLRMADGGWRIEEPKIVAEHEAAGPANTQSASPSLQSDESAIRHPPSAIGRRVLLVEDAADTLEMLKVFLEASGYEVTACESATDALAVAVGRQFDIIVSDIGLPNTDGYELLRRLRRDASHLAAVPAVALTGYAAPRDVELAREAGFAAHVAKPFEPAALTESIARLLAAGTPGNDDETVAGTRKSGTRES